MKNKMICALLTTVMVLSFAACGSQGNGAAASTESTVTSESGAEASTAESSAAEASAETTTEASADAANVLHMKTTLQFPQRMLPLSLKRSRMP